MGSKTTKNEKFGQSVPKRKPNDNQERGQNIPKKPPKNDSKSSGKKGDT